MINTTENGILKTALVPNTLEKRQKKYKKAHIDSCRNTAYESRRSPGSF